MAEQKGVVGRKTTKGCEVGKDSTPHPFQDSPLLKESRGEESRIKQKDRRRRRKEKGERRVKEERRRSCKTRKTSAERPDSDRSHEGKEKVLS